MQKHGSKYRNKSAAIQPVPALLGNKPGRDEAILNDKLAHSVAQGQLIPKGDYIENNETEIDNRKMLCRNVIFKGKHAIWLYPLIVF